MVTSNNKKTLALIFLVAFTVLIAVAGVLYGSRLVNLPENKLIAVFIDHVDFFKPRVNTGTILTKEMLFICGDVEVISKEPAPEILRGLSREELVEKFTPEGLKVTFIEPKSLILTEQSDEFCSAHKKYRHLGLYQGRLAIYEGPLGYNERIIRLESITVAGLPGDLQIKLQQAMDFNKLAGVAAEKLRDELEFKTEEALNAVLENIDEHS